MLIVSELFYPNKTSTAYIMTEIAKKMAMEEDVVVITSDVKYDSNVYEGSENLSGIKIVHQTSVQFNKNNTLLRALGSFVNSLLLSLSIFSNIKKNEKLLAVTNPFLLILIIAVIKKVKKFDYTLLVHDVFPENTVPAAISNKNSFTYQTLLKAYNWAYRQADQLIVLGSDMKQLIAEKGIKENKIKVIPNWYDDDLETRSINKNEYYHNIDTKNKIIIGFAGNIGRVQGLERFIAVFNKVSNPDLLLFIIGEGANLEICKKLAASPNIYFLGAKPRHEQILFLNSFDIGLITLAEGMYGIGVPSKTYNLLALGKPVFYVGDKNSEIDVLNHKQNIGWSFDWSEEEKMIKTLNTIKSVKFSAQNMNLAHSNFRKDIILEKIKKVVFDV